jgi:hypothetical protein
VSMLMICTSVYLGTLLILTGLYCIDFESGTRSEKKPRDNGTQYGSTSLWSEQYSLVAHKSMLCKVSK